MSAEPEDEFIDKELRNAFQDYDLPPAEHMHVWTGVAQRIAELPVPRTSLASRLALPIGTAMLGVAVGWLLPRPAPTPPQPTPVATPAALGPQVSAAAQPLATQTQVPALLPASAAPALATAATPNLTPARRHDVLRRPTAPTNAVAPPAADSATMASPSTAQAKASASTPAVLPDSVALDRHAASALLSPPLPAADSLPATAPKALASSKDERQPIQVADQSSKVLKPQGADKIVYHKPRQRQSEQGHGIRRWFTHLGQSIRHFFSL